MVCGAPMATYTSFGIGGPADVLVDAASVGEVVESLAAAARLRVPSQIIGLGTNLLVRDGGIRGLVVRVGPRMGGLEWDDEATAVVAGAGIPLAELSAALGRRSWTGLEWAEGIPGTLGGALVMNAGAYGGEISDVVEWVEVIEAVAVVEGQVPSTTVLSLADLGYSYRRSALQQGRHVALRARLRLARGDAAEIGTRMAEFAARRRDRQPLEYPSAGSFFMRPSGHYVGPMIEECGLKGLRVGGAEVSEKHANFIINTGGATAADVLALAELVRRAVHERYGVDLHPEVRILGEPSSSDTDTSDASRSEASPEL